MPAPRSPSVVLVTAELGATKETAKWASRLGTPLRQGLLPLGSERRSGGLVVSAGGQVVPSEGTHRERLRLAHPTAAAADQSLQGADHGVLLVGAEFGENRQA